MGKGGETMGLGLPEAKGLTEDGGLSRKGSNYQQQQVRRYFPGQRGNRKFGIV